MNVKKIEELEKNCDNCVKTIKELKTAISNFKANEKSARKLIEYYYSDEWMDDYEASNKTNVLQNLKAGILSEDVIYDYLSMRNNVALEMLELCLQILKHE